MVLLVGMSTMIHFGFSDHFTSVVSIDNSLIGYWLVLCQCPPSVYTTGCICIRLASVCWIHVVPSYSFQAQFLWFLLCCFLLYLVSYPCHVDFYFVACCEYVLSSRLLDVYGSSFVCLFGGSLLVPVGLLASWLVPIFHRWPTVVFIAVLCNVSE